LEAEDYDLKRDLFLTQEYFALPAVKSSGETNEDEFSRKLLQQYRSIKSNLSKLIPIVLSFPAAMANFSDINRMVYKFVSSDVSHVFPELFE
jgi:hypothetical protein